MKKRADGRGVAIVSSTSRAIADGEVDLSDWTDRELLEGRRADRNGKFTGKKPKLIPRQLVMELNRRRMGRAQALLLYSSVDAIEVLRSIVNDKQAARRTRIRAAEILLEQGLGKPRERMSLDVTRDDDVLPWQPLMVNAIVGTPEQAKQLVEESEAQPGDVIEGEVVEYDESPAKGPARDARGRFVKNRRPSARDERRSR
jgi:hypothetical protein